jgi:hypothetical protein
MENDEKTTYMKCQCKYMERCYDDGKLPPIYHEIMCTNSFYVKASGRAVAFDVQNKNYNLLLKNIPISPSLDLSIMGSRHVMVGDKSSKEMWGLPRQRNGMIRGTLLETDILELESIIISCRIFVTHDVMAMNKDYFWNVVCPKVGVGSQ